jgi:hypothetical protein
MRVNMVDVFLYENKRTKSVEIVLRMGIGRGGRMIKEVKATKLHYNQIYKYQNAYPVYNYYILVKR